MCRREGGGGVCAAWTFCWDKRVCSLLSRLPDSLEPASPPGLVGAALGLNNYNAKCGSGYSIGEALGGDILDPWEHIGQSRAET
jgi:hypothetical protein